VNGKIIAEELKVQDYSNWPDFVFEKDYRPMTLHELEQYIKDNKHLPGIPSAEEVKNNGGVEVGDMLARLLKQIEELTLQNVEQQKEIDELKKLIVTK
jgi:hypothetical protein